MFFKIALSSLTQFLATESPLKMMKDAFYFILKAPLRSSPPVVLFRKGVLKICRKFTGEHPC